jgi:hypothetical protein
MVEHLTNNPKMDGSYPAIGTERNKMTKKARVFSTYDTATLICVTSKYRTRLKGSDSAQTL